MPIPRRKRIIRGGNRFRFASTDKFVQNTRGCIKDLRNYKLMVYPSKPRGFKLVPKYGSGKYKDYDLLAQHETQASEWYKKVFIIFGFKLIDFLWSSFSPCIPHISFSTDYFRTKETKPKH